MFAKGQTTYNPSQPPGMYQTLNKPIGSGQAFNVEARSLKADSVNFVYRPYNGTSEVLSYLNLPKYRYGWFPIFVNVGGSLQSNGTFIGGQIQVYWFRDGTADGNLIRWYTDSTSASGAFFAIANNLSEGNPGLIKGNLSLDLVTNTSDAQKWIATATLTNKTMSGLSNTFTNIPNSALQNNAIGLSITSNAGSDISVTTTPASLGTSLVFNVPTASGSQRGALAPGDWAIFAAKQNAITLTTSGSTGPATFIANVLNIPQYVSATPCFNCNADSLMTFPFDTTNTRNNYVIAYDSVNRKLFLTPQTGGGGSGINQLTGDGTAGPGSGSQVFTLATVNSNVGTFGSATTVPQITLNGKGLATAAVGVSIQIAESQVTNLTTDLAGKVGTSLNSGQIFVGGAANVVNNVTPSGAVSMTNTGVFSLTANSVATSNIQANAVTLAKMATNTSNTLLGYDGVGNPVDVTLTTTGTSGTASLVAGVLNIPHYSDGQTLTYTQNATNNTLAISGGNTQTFLTATTNLAGLMDTARTRWVDSGRNRLFSFAFVQGLQPAGLDSAQLGGSFYKPDTLDFAYQPFLWQHVTSASSLSVGDSVTLIASNGQVKKGATTLFGGITAAQVAFNLPQKISSPLGISYWNDYFFSSSGAIQNYTTAGTVTLAQNGNFLKFRGGTFGTYTNYLYKNVTSYSEWMDNWVKVSVDSIGTAFGGLTWGKGAGGNPLLGAIDLRTTSSHNLTIVSAGTVVATKTPATLAPAQGDTLTLHWYIHQDTVRFAVYDQTSSVSDSVQYVFPSTTFNDATTGTYPTFGNYTLGSQAGAYTMVYQSVVTDNPYRSILAVLGHSIVQGYDGGSFANRLSERLAATYGYVPAFGSSGDVFANVEARLMDVIRIQPRNVVIYIGCNDVRNLITAGWTTPQILAYIKVQMGALLSRLQRAGIWPIIIYTPETGTAATQQYEADSLLRVNWPQYYCAVYDTIASNTASFITGSGGIHLSSSGMAAAVAYMVNHANIQVSTYVPNHVAGGEGYPTFGDTAQITNTWKFNTSSPFNNGYGIENAEFINQDSGGSTSPNVVFRKYSGTTAAINFEQMILTGSNWATSSTFESFTASGLNVYKVQVDGSIFFSGTITSQNTGVPFKNSRGDTWTMAYDATYGTGDNVIWQSTPGSGGYTRYESNGPAIIGSIGANPIWFDANRAHAGSSPTGFPFGITGTNIPTFNTPPVINNVTVATGSILIQGTDSVVHKLGIGSGLSVVGGNLTAPGGGTGGSSPPFNSDASHPILRDFADTTKLLDFNISALTTASTTTIIVPNGGGTMAFINTNQTFSGSNTFTPSQTFSGGLTAGSVTNNTTITASNSLTGTNGQPVLQLNSTLNDGTTIATVIDLSATNTATNASSMLFRLRSGSAGTTDEFHILMDGSVTSASGNFNTSGTTLTLANNHTNSTLTFGSTYGTNDNLVQGRPGAGTGYSVFEDGTGIGVIISGVGVHPIKFAPNRTVVAQFFGGTNFAVGSTTDNNAFIQIGANTTTNASMFFNGAASDVTSPTNGMMWYNSSTHALNFRDNGATLNLLAGSFYNTVQANTSAQTQRPNLNFKSDFTVADNSGNSSTDISIASTKLSSGVWTPTVTAGTNVSAGSGNKCTYTRTDSIVTFAGSINATITLAATASSVTVSLPIGSTFTAATDANGVLGSNTALSLNPENLIANTSTNTLTINFGSGSSTGGYVIYFSGQYTIH